jgi:hypothetical protein
MSYIDWGPGQIDALKEESLKLMPVSKYGVMGGKREEVR